MVNEKIMQIKKGMETMSGRYSVRQIFEDWIEIAAISLLCLTRGNKEDNEKLRSLYDRYTEEEKKQLLTWVALLAEACTEEMADHIGNLYMNLDFGKRGLGQVFTPYHISKMMSKITFNADELKDKEIITVNDPCCGAGAMLIAYCDVLRESSINYKKRALVVAQDVDSLCCMMCYIQLTMFGIPGIVKCGNSLTEPFTGKIDDNTYLTLQYLINYEEGLINTDNEDVA